MASFTSLKNTDKVIIAPTASYMSVSKWNEEYLSADEDNEDDDLVTKEKLLRDMLVKPVRRKKKGDSK